MWECGEGLTQTDRQTDTQTRVTTIHFASSATDAKCNKAPEESTLIIENIRIHACNTVYDKPKEASVPKTSSIRSAVSTKHRLVTDRQTDTQTDTGP